MLFRSPTEAKTGWNWGDQVLWTKADEIAGKCKPEKVGTVKENPDGLIKWKGGDIRKRLWRPTKFNDLFA